MSKTVFRSSKEKKNHLLGQKFQLRQPEEKEKNPTNENHLQRKA